MKKVLFYFKQMFEGADGKPSIRNYIAFFTSIDLIWNCHKTVDVTYKVITLYFRNRTIDFQVVTQVMAAISSEALIIGVEFSLIVALLSLKTIEAIKNQQSADNK